MNADAAVLRHVPLVIPRAKDTKQHSWFCDGDYLQHSSTDLTPVSGANNFECTQSLLHSSTYPTSFSGAKDMDSFCDGDYLQRPSTDLTPTSGDNDFECLDPWLGNIYCQP